MRDKKIIKRETLYIIQLALITRGIIFFKDILVASKVGINYKMDSYLLALSTIMLFTNIIADGMIVALIPLLQDIEEKHDRERRLDFTNNLINSLIIIGLILIALGIILAPFIIRIFGPGFKDLELGEAIKLFRIGLPIIILSWLRAIGGGVLQSDHAFRAGAKGGVSSQLVFVIYLLFFAQYFGLEGLMIAGSLAVISQIYILVGAMKKKGFKYKWKLDLKDRYLPRLLKYLLPIALGVGVNQLNNSIDNGIASTLSTGSIAELSYANDIINFFLGIFTAAIVTVIFPVLSESHNRKRPEDLREGINYAIYSLLLISIPVSIILMLMAKPIVKLVFERGAFDAMASFLTAESLGYYAVGLPAMALIPLLTRVYYSIRDMKTPLLISIATLLVNVIVDLSLAPYMGARGIALGTSFSVIFGATLGLVDLNRRIQFTSIKDIWETLAKLSLAIIIMIAGITLTYGAAATSLRNLFLHNLITVIASSGIGLGLYYMSNKFFNS